MPLVDYKKYLKPIQKETIRVGNDVWIGNGANILNNVIIGSGAVVGAMAVVTKDVPPYAIVVGNPARIKKFRFTEKQIAALLTIAWWDWPSEKIMENAELLFSDHIESFINKFIVSHL